MPELMTFKSGKFVFSANYDTLKILPKLVEATTQNKTIIDLPILPDLAATMVTELIRRSIFGTAAIEGNPLSEERVGEIIGQPDTLAQSDSEREIKNLKNAYSFVEQSSRDDSIVLSEKLIRDLHKTIAMGIDYPDTLPGNYRNDVVKVGDNAHGGIYQPPKILKDISLLMAHYVQWLNSAEIKGAGGIVRSILAHYYLALIHPFGDGNGRTARLVEAYLFKKQGFLYVPEMLSNYYYRNRDAYYWAFSKSIKNRAGDLTEFLDFALSGVLESLNTVKSQIIAFIRRDSLKNYYRQLHETKSLSRRQYDLITVVQSMNIPFTLNELHRKAPFAALFQTLGQRTIRRDMDRLKEFHLITLNKNGQYMCNINVLDRQ